MSESVADVTANSLRTFADIPRLSLLRFLRTFLSPAGGRNDMLTPQMEAYRQHGSVVCQFAGPLPMVYLFGPDANRRVLLDADHIFSARKPWMQIMGKIFPNGLLLRDGDEHKQHRKLMYEAFKRPVLRQYAARMSPMIESEVGHWSGAAPQLMFPAFKDLTLRMAAAIFLGVDVSTGLSEMNRAFEDMVAASMSRLRLPLPGFEFGRGLKGRSFMLKYLGDKLAARRRSDGGDMFTRLCRAQDENGDSFSDQDILDHTVFLMMAAHDTTTSTLTSLTYELARHPEWQERCRQESMALRGALVELEDLDGLSSLDLVLRETLRRYPPLPVIPRVATASFEFDGYRIPADTMVVVSPILTHYLEEWWSDPLRFDPERFSPQRAEDERHTHSWVPFGGGPHMCIGKKFAEAQVRLVMHHMLLRYRWSVADGYVMPVQQAPISKPRDGLPVQLVALS